MTIRLLPLAALLALGSTPLLAAGPIQTNQVKTSPRLLAEFKARDTNHDGVLTKPEVAAGVAHMKVGGGATKAAQAKVMTDVLFSYADANHDGKITLAEMQSQTEAMAAKFDTNHDGVVSREEQRAAQARMLAETQAAPSGR